MMGVSSIIMNQCCCCHLDCHHRLTTNQKSKEGIPGASGLLIRRANLSSGHATVGQANETRHGKTAVINVLVGSNRFTGWKNSMPMIPKRGKAARASQDGVLYGTVTIILSTEARDREPAGTISLGSC
eukprot:scaffold7458_cov60-Attheya_sp.AAC.2